MLLPTSLLLLVAVALNPTHVEAKPLKFGDAIAATHYPKQRPLHSSLDQRSLQCGYHGKISATHLVDVRNALREMENFGGKVCTPARGETRMCDRWTQTTCVMLLNSEDHDRCSFVTEVNQFVGDLIKRQEECGKGEQPTLQDSVFDMKYTIGHRNWRPKLEDEWGWVATSGTGSA
ncbi:MAG: hypothetical protein M1821_009313 [Bathelium mastoideum]|nr:MAG: hypothetical protein M1821_009313 [Bathelium mastoideum]KAI9686934.1 MAG: hypothetical protein M1822_002687 [Bathelium mastoideum]